MSRVAHGGKVDLLNEFIGLEAGPVENNEKVIAMPFSHEVHYSPTPSVYYTSEVLEFIRGRYHSTRKPVLPEVVDIAVHIRRGDVDATPVITRGTLTIRPIFRSLVD
jgi:iron-sulfur cluster repair protein YtfE (RIC family)